MGTPVVGKAVKFGAGDTDLTKQFEVLWPFEFGRLGTLVESNGLRGTRQRFSTGVNDGTYTVGGRVAMDVRPDTMDFWWPKIVGGTKSGNDIAFAETLPSFVAGYDDGTMYYKANSCKVNVADLSGQSGEDLRLEMDIEGLTDTVAATGTFPSISGTLSVEQPFIFHQGVFNLAGTSYPFRRFRSQIDNKLVLDRFMNTQSRTALPEGDLIVSLQTENPFTSTEYSALYSLGVAGLACTLVFTNGTNVMTITLANVKKAITPPQHQGRELETMLPLNWTACSKGGVDAIKITNTWTAGSGV